MSGVLRTLAALAVLGLVAAGAVVGLGLYNVSAKVGHMPGVSAVLHTTFRNAVRLRAMPADEVPDLSDPALAELGREHYASACAPCHAMPGAERTATMRAMLPAPPHVDEAVADWQPQHLHWIVANGIKMSGMPAWPAPHRSEEVWPVVAYLMRVKAGTAPDAPTPDAPTTEVPADAPPFAGYCASCHGAVAGHVPRLDIQSADYLQHALEDYRDGRRRSGIMQHAATTVPDDALPALAAYFAARDRQGGTARAGTEATATGETGQALARQGTRDVPACTACHGPGPARKAGTPALAGQDEAFLAAQLRLWRDGTRGGSQLMTKAAHDLTDADIAELSAWYAAQTPEGAAAGATTGPAAQPGD